MDAELYEKPEEEEEAATVYDQDDPPEEDAPIKEIFAAAAEWEVGSAIQRVREARRIMKERADEAIEYILENKLANNSGLEYRALQSLAEFSEDFRDRLLERATDVDSLGGKDGYLAFGGERKTAGSSLYSVITSKKGNICPHAFHHWECLTSLKA